MTSPDGRPPSLRLRPSAGAGKTVAAGPCRFEVVVTAESGGNHPPPPANCSSLAVSASTLLGKSNAPCASSFILSCRLRGRAAGRRAHHAGAILPIATRAFDRRVGRRRRTGHRGAPDGAMVVGAARPSVHRREPAG